MECLKKNLQLFTAVLHKYSGDYPVKIHQCKTERKPGELQDRRYTRGVLGHVSGGALHRDQCYFLKGARQVWLQSPAVRGPRHRRLFELLHLEIPKQVQPSTSPGAGGCLVQCCLGGSPR